MNPATAESRTPVTVLTGFLGSGKTTLLNALLRHPGMAETAVLVNEFGEVGIDHLLFEALDDDVLLLAAGCLCCTIREDMVASLRSLFERRAGGQVPEFRRVVIETTGLADPAPILHTLLAGDPAPMPWAVDGVVTTVDAANGNRQLSTHSESVKQAAVADRLLVTKSGERAISRPCTRMRDQGTRRPIFVTRLDGSYSGGDGSAAVRHSWKTASLRGRRDRPAGTMSGHLPSTSSRLRGTRSLVERNAWNP